MASERCWWAFAKTFRQLPLEARKKVSCSRQLRSAYLRISQVHAYYGSTLDNLNAPLHVHAFVAYTPDSLLLPRAAGQQARFDAVMKFFEVQKRWPPISGLKRLTAEIEARWLGPPDPPVTLSTSSPPPQAESPAPAPDPGHEAAKEAAKEAPSVAPGSAEYARQIAAQVAKDDPEMAGLLEQLATLRQQQQHQRQ